MVNGAGKEEPSLCWSMIKGVNDLSGLPLKGTNWLILVEVPVQVNIYTKREGREKKIIHFIIRRESLADRWFIDRDSLYEALRKRGV